MDLVKMFSWVKIHLQIPYFFPLVTTVRSLSRCFSIPTHSICVYRCLQKWRWWRWCHNSLKLVVVSVVNRPSQRCEGISFMFLCFGFFYLVMDQVAFEEEAMCRDLYVGENWNECWKECKESMLLKNGEALICKWKYFVFAALCDHPLFPFGIKFNMILDWSS